MKELNFGVEVTITSNVNIVNLMSGNPIQVPKGTTGKIFEVNKGTRYGTRRYLVAFTGLADAESRDRVRGWIPWDHVAPAQEYDEHGHKVYWLTGPEAAKVIADAFYNDEVRRVYVGDDTANHEDLSDTDAVNLWYEIAPLENLPFDNYKEEHLLMMGLLGGGSIDTAYYNTLNDSPADFAPAIQKMLENATGNYGDNHYYLQLIEKDYPGDERMEL